MLSSKESGLYADTGVLERLCDVALKTAAIYALYWFGSRVRGDFRPQRDYDLFVVTWEGEHEES